MLNERFGEKFMGRKQKEVTPLIIAPETPKIITQYLILNLYR
jgi:hypothetical protein